MVLFLIILALNCPFSIAAESQLFDFESGTLAGWTVVGENPFYNQAPVHKDTVAQWKRGPTGFIGNYYLENGCNAGRHENNPDGSLISPEFKITKDCLNFYLAGELHPEVFVALQINGGYVRKAFGNNIYDLVLRGWDVRPFKNKKARIIIRDANPQRSLLRVDHIFLSDTPAPTPEIWVKRPSREESNLLRPGEFQIIFNARSLPDSTWCIDHHHILYGGDNQWHLYASAWPAASQWNRNGKKYIIHATSDELLGNWTFQGIVLEADPAWGESHLADPVVVYHKGRYLMYYQGAGNAFSGFYDPPGGKHKLWYGGRSGDIGPFRMFIATSRNGYHWERYTDDSYNRPGVIFTDKPFAETPYITNIDSTWIMYYAACAGETVFDKHAIGYRTSSDLLHWSTRKIALRDWTPGDANALNRGVPASPWPEHTFFRYPVVLRRGKVWYLMAGSIDNGNLSRYHCLRIYRSDNPFVWDNHEEALHQSKRLFIDGGGKIFRDTDGKWYVSSTNSMHGGVWVAPLYWNDGLDDQDTSILPAGKPLNP